MVVVRLYRFICECSWTASHRLLVSHLAQGVDWHTIISSLLVLAALRLQADSCNGLPVLLCVPYVHNCHKGAAFPISCTTVIGSLFS